MKKRTRYYHYIIGREYNERFGDTSTRREYITKNKDLHEPKGWGWVVIGCCGYHDKVEKGEILEWSEM